MLVIDRFEENWAVVEYNNVTFNIPRELLPPDAREGDVLNIIITVNTQVTSDYSEDMETLINKTFK